MKQNPTCPVQCKTKTPPFLIAVALALTCVAFSPAPNAFGVVPAPDGGYPGFNTAEGQNALFGLTTGVANTALGWLSLKSNTDGSFNTGVGAGTLLFNIGNQDAGEGIENTAIGAAALLSNSTGYQNTANGAVALLSNTEGHRNTASGYRALFSNTEGGNNTATGAVALFANTTGFGNTANGAFALQANTTANNNTAVGIAALFNNIDGGSNTALGGNAGGAVFTASNVICIGEGVLGANESNSCFIGQIFGKTSAGGTAVYVNSLGKLGTVVSSRRFKDEIKPMDKASEAILALKPVTFRYKHEIDPTRSPQFGLVAEEVEKVNPDLVVRDAEGKVNTVRYEAVNAMLLNEFLKEHRNVEELKSTAVKQEATIAELKKDFRATVAQLTARLEEQASQIQKVNAKLELSRSIPQTIVENR